MDALLYEDDLIEGKTPNPTLATFPHASSEGVTLGFQILKLLNLIRLDLRGSFPTFIVLLLMTPDGGRRVRPTAAEDDPVGHCGWVLQAHRIFPGGPLKKNLLCYPLWLQKKKKRKRKKGRPGLRGPWEGGRFLLNPILPVPCGLIADITHFTSVRLDARPSWCFFFFYCSSTG